MAARAQRQDGYDSYGEGDSYGEEARGEEGLSKEQYVAEQRLLRGSAAHSFEGSEHSEEEDAMPLLHEALDGMRLESEPTTAEPGGCHVQ